MKTVSESELVVLRWLRAAYYLARVAKYRPNDFSGSSTTWPHGLCRSDNQQRLKRCTACLIRRWARALKSHHLPQLPRERRTFHTDAHPVPLEERVLIPYRCKNPPYRCKNLEGQTKQATFHYPVFGGSNVRWEQRSVGATFGGSNVRWE
jgi:hypothetical protein